MKPLLLFTLALSAWSASSFAAEKDSSMREVVFQWEAVKEATRYEVEISANPSFNPVYMLWGAETNSLTVAIPIGKYYYRIRGIDRVAIPGEWGPAGLLEVDPSLPKPVARVPKPDMRTKSYLYCSLGVSGVTYRQDDVPDLSLMAATVKLSFQRSIIQPNWDFGANAFVTALPLTSNRPGVTARFLGANLRFGYAPSFIHDPWRLSLLTGFSYSRMFVSGDVFGFDNLLYPQIYPTIRRRLAGGSAIFAYLKYVPLAGFLKLSLADRELAAGVGWQLPIASGETPLIWSLDYSDLRLSGVAESRSRTQSLSLSLGIGF
jgi:hypothetical protein